MADFAYLMKNRLNENCEGLDFQTTPIWKIFVLSILTGGLYHIVYFYSLWKTIKVKFGFKNAPFWRALFSGITNFWLFPILGVYFERFNNKIKNASLLATFYFLICWVSNRMAMSTWNSELINYGIEVLDLFLTLVLTLIVVKFQSIINKINQENFPNAEVNGWKLSNTIWSIVFALLTILYFIPIE